MGTPRVSTTWWIPLLVLATTSLPYSTSSTSSSPPADHIKPPTWTLTPTASPCSSHPTSLSRRLSRLPTIPSSTPSATAFSRDIGAEWTMKQQKLNWYVCVHGRCGLLYKGSLREPTRRTPFRLDWSLVNGSRPSWSWLRHYIFIMNVSIPLISSCRTNESF